MAYTVNKTNSSASPNLYTVNNSVVNTETDISFIGKGYAGYGETIAENFLHLLENFSNTASPSKPIIGQLWWDSTNAKLKVTFHWPFYGNYWIIDLGGDYEYAVVSEPKRQYLWVLSREPTMDMLKYNQLVEFLEERKFDI